MSQDQPQLGNLGEHLGNEHLPIHSTLGFREQLPPPPGQEANGSAAASGRYWRLLIDPRLSSLGIAAAQPPISPEVFLGLTHQVQVLSGMMQTIIPLVPHLAQLPTLPQMPQRESLPPAPT